MKHDEDKAPLPRFRANETSSLEVGRKSGAKKPSVLQTVLVAAFVSLVVGAITFRAFAAMYPGTSSPVIAFEEHPVIPAEYVAEVLAHASAPSNSTHGLGKRELTLPPPADSHCASNDIWLRRACAPSASQSAWDDICRVAKRDNRGRYYNDPRAGQYAKHSTCPADHECADHEDQDGAQTIFCVPRRPMQDFAITIDWPKRRIMQYGFVEADLVSGSDKIEQRITIELKADIGGATASGFISDAKFTYVIAPQNALVGHARGGEVPMCQSIDHVARSCYPMARHDFEVGSHMDYTFGLSALQQGVLFYSIYGSHG